MPFEDIPEPKPLWLRATGWVAGVALTAVTVSAVTSIPAGIAISSAVNTTVAAWEDIDATITEPPLPSASVLRTKQGTIIARFASYDRTLIPYDDISPHAIDALLAVEDTRFYDHSGVDIVGLTRALRNNLASSSTQGGSTITQQYVKNLRLLEAELAGDEDGMQAATTRTLDRKLSEARAAIELEKTLSKEQILTRYLNIVNFGSGAYGIQAAATRYFSTDASDLTPAQAATLIGIINRPADYNPVTNPQLSKKRRDFVLARMNDTGYLTNQQTIAAQNQPLNLNVTGANRGCEAARGDWGHYCQAAVEELLTGGILDPDPIKAAAIWKQGGLDITTALDETVQDKAVRAVRDNVPPSSRVSGMGVVIEPGTGNVAAMAISKNFGTGRNETQVPLATVDAFGPGSTMKLFTLAAAVNDGIDLNTRLPGGVRYTSPVSDNPESGAFNNYNTSPASNVTITESIRRSLNTSMIQLSERIGIRNVAALAKDLGATSIPLEGDNAVTDKEGSFTLGARGIPVVEMANSYATIAAGGLACQPNYVLSITRDDSTRAIEPRCERVLTEPAAQAITYALRQVVASGTGTRAQLTDRDVAGKTGTGQNVAAAWFVGFTPQYAMAVALADPRGPAYPLANVLDTPRIYGGTIPAQTFKQAMDSIHENLPALDMVDELNTSYLLTGPVTRSALVPATAGMDAVTAAAAVKDAGFTIGQWSEGTVTGTIPAGGTRAPIGATVTILTDAQEQ